MKLKYWIQLCLFIMVSKNTYAQKIEIGQILTSKGEILFTFSEYAPNHKKSFVQLAKAGYWDSLCFNRVVPNFVIQGGCPDTEAGFTDSTYLLAPEFHPSLKHVYGAVGMGRDDNKNMYSATCQFYIVVNKKGIPRLDNNYTIFGKVIKGIEVADAISNAPKNKLDEPNDRVSVDVNILKLSKKQLKKRGVLL